MAPASSGTRVPLLQLEAATLLSGAGNGAALVVLPWIALELTGSAGSAGLLAAATAVPLLASSLISGTVVDTLGRRRTSVVSDLLSAASVAAIPIVGHLFGLGLGWLVVLAVLGAVFDPAGVTARETMLPAAAARAGWPLHRANGVHEAVWGVAFLLGPGVGGVLIAWVGAISALWFTAGAFLVSAVLVAGLRVEDAGRPAEHHAPVGVWSGTREGLGFVWRDHLLRALLVMTAVLVSVYMPVEGVLLPVEFEAQDQPGRLGLVVMAMSLGGVAGALGYGLVGRRWRRSTVYRGALVMTGVFLMVLAVLPPFPVMLVASLVHRRGLRTGRPPGEHRDADPQPRAHARQGRRHHHLGGVRRRPVRLPGGRRSNRAVRGAADVRRDRRDGPRGRGRRARRAAVGRARLAARGTGADVVGASDGASRLETALGVATSGPLPLVQPPRDPVGPAEEPRA